MPGGPLMSTARKMPVAFGPGFLNPDLAFLDLRQRFEV